MKTIRNIRLLIPVFAASLILASCEPDTWHNLKGHGPVVTETREVPIHRDVFISIPADVYIYQSPVRDLTIKAQANILEAIETNVSGNELKIKLGNGAGLGSHERIKIYISSAMYNTIRLSGSVNLYSETPVVTDDFEVNISGSGTVDVDVEANTVKALISGSGNMWITGSAIDEEFIVSGSGDIHSFGLQCETSDINISGSGSVEASVTDYLRAQISGSGKIYYSGSPSVDSYISGSGKVIQSN